MTWEIAVTYHVADAATFASADVAEKYAKWNPPWLGFLLLTFLNMNI
jgi:hypothetical protein